MNLAFNCFPFLPVCQNKRKLTSGISIIRSDAKLICALFLMLLRFLSHMRSFTVKLREKGKQFPHKMKLIRRTHEKLRRWVHIKSDDYKKRKLKGRKTRKSLKIMLTLETMTTADEYWSTKASLSEQGKSPPSDKDDGRWLPWSTRV